MREAEEYGSLVSSTIWGNMGYVRIKNVNVRVLSEDVKVLSEDVMRHQAAKGAKYAI